MAQSKVKFTPAPKPTSTPIAIPKAPKPSPTGKSSNFSERDVNAGNK